MVWMRRGVPILAIVFLVAAPALSQPSTSSSLVAEALFREGVRLMDEKRFVEACPKFEESAKLERLSSTLLNLANCHEKAGQIASAWIVYAEAASLARREKNEDNAKTGQRRALALEAKVPMIAIVVREPVPSGLEVRRGGRVLSPAEWGTMTPVDPGAIVVEVTAPGRKPWRHVVQAQADGARQTIPVPVLEPLAPAVPLASSAVPMPPAPPPSVPAPASGMAVQKIVGIALGSVGLVGLGLGGYFGLRAKGLYDDSLAYCPRGKNLCDAKGISLRDDARTAGTVATVATIVGGAFAVGGVILWFTAPRTAESRAGIRVVPTMGGLIAEGAW
jgi:hypothetical protein